MVTDTHTRLPDDFKTKENSGWILRPNNNCPVALPHESGGGATAACVSECLPQCVFMIAVLLCVI